MKTLEIKDYPDRQLITIEGINYSYGLFEEWGTNGMPEKTLFKLVKREDGLIIIQRVEK